MRLSEARAPTEVRGRAIRRVWLAAAAALILLFALQGLRRIALESDLRAYAYEDLLGQIHLDDGWMARRFLVGDARYVGTGRNLAVNLLFAPVARLSPDYPQDAKRLNLAVSCAALGALLFFARRRFGEAASLVAGLLFVLSGVVVFEAARSAAEPLLMLCVVLAWGLAGEGRWGAAGASAGVAWGAKASGVALLPAGLAAIATEALASRAPRAGARSAVRVVVGFFLASAPFWGGRALEGRGPLDASNLGVLWSRVEAGEATARRAELLSPESRERMATGVVRAAETLARALIPSPDRAVGYREFPWTGIADFSAEPPSTAFDRLRAGTRRPILWAVFLAVVVGAAACLAAGRDRAGPWMLVAFFLPTAWSLEVFRMPRFFAPMVPLAAVCLAGPLCGRLGARARLGVPLAVLLVAAALLPERALTLRRAWPGAQDLRETIRFLQANTPAEGRCAFLPSEAVTFTDHDLLPTLLRPDLHLAGASPGAHRARALARGERCVFLEADKRRLYAPAFGRLFEGRAAERPALFATELRGWRILAEPARHLHYLLLEVAPDAASDRDAGGVSAPPE